ncbi:MAG: hypothetical protein QM769_14770 [Pseudoxanthomonas sp.]
MHAFMRTLAFAALLPLVVACGKKPQAQPDVVGNTPQPTSVLGSKMQKAMDKAKAELDTKNISVGDADISINGWHIGHDAGNLPKAEITPQGELLIDGKQVAATPEQQTRLLAYRSELLAIAKAGMDIGVQGADLGMKAAGEALKGLFSGTDEKEIEKRVEAQAEGIKTAAKQLCQRLPALLGAQQELAAAMPEFAPYATMDASDIDDCISGIDHKDGVAVMSGEDREKLQQEIRNVIRKSTQAAVGKDAKPAVEQQ